jgi:aspartate 1-decarboxylase
VASEAVEGTFTVTGSNVSGIKVYIMDDTNFVKWQNGNAFSTYYNSGEATSGDIPVGSPPGGTYHLIFDNTFSTTSKNITAEICTVVLPVD